MQRTGTTVVIHTVCPARSVIPTVGALACSSLEQPRRQFATRASDAFSTGLTLYKVIAEEYDEKVEAPTLSVGLA